MLIPEDYPLNGDTLGGPVNPADLLGAVRVYRPDAAGTGYSQEFDWVPVSLRSPVVGPDGLPLPDFHDPEYGHSLWEYVDRAGNVRAALITVPPNRVTPAWSLAEAAANGLYLDTSRAVSGIGVLAVRKGDGAAEERYIVSPTDQPWRAVGSGDTFQYAAGGSGLAILSLNPQAPFRDEYESRSAAPMYTSSPLADR